MIFDILEKNKLIFEDSPHKGMAGKEDAMICHRGKPYKLEIKDGLEADYGQKKFNWSKKGGWTWSEDDEVTRLYTDIGALSYINHKKITPKRYSKPKDELTYEDAQTDADMFEDRTYKVKPEVLWRYYAIKDVHYIQVGSGYGFYHLDKDVANFGTEPFVANLILRFRRKYHDRKERLRNAKRKIIKEIETPWNYSFMAVLKVVGKKKPKRSKYNIEESEDQEPPQIRP